jgi:RNA polymerase sigma-70 factor
MKGCPPDPGETVELVWSAAAQVTRSAHAAHAAMCCSAADRIATASVPPRNASTVLSSRQPSVTPADATTELRGRIAAMSTLEVLYARGREAHPNLRVSEEAFRQHIARCVDAASGGAVDGLFGPDLYLACACVQRARGAVSQFEVQFGTVIRRAVWRVVAARDDRDDAEQRVMQHLLVGSRGAAPALAKYPGNAPLARWISVVAIRLAISLKRSVSSERRLREKVGAEALSVSPEQMLMKAEIRRAVEPAIEEAVGRLGDRDRLILRLLLVGGMNLHAIGNGLGLSHQAVSKRIAKARETLLEDIRRTVASKLNLPKSDLSSVLRFVASHLDVNISRVLRAS